MMLKIIPSFKSPVRNHKCPPSAPEEKLVQRLEEKPLEVVQYLEQKHLEGELLIQQGDVPTIEDGKLVLQQDCNKCTHSPESEQLIQTLKEDQLDTNIQTRQLI